MLLPAQTQAIAALQRYKVGALFMEAGTGKTRAALELVRSISDADLVVWLTPCQTKENLFAEINKHGGLSTLHICGIESLSNSDRIYLELLATIEKARCPVIVCDESLKIKNWDAKRTKRIITISKLSQYKLILNGTPLSRNLLDLWAQFQFLSPRILNMDIAEYKNTFCEYITRTTRVGRQSIKREWITKYHNVDYLYSLIKHYVYECDLQLDVQKQYFDFDYQIEDELKKEYQRLKEKYLDNETLILKNNNIFLELTQKMQHTYACAAEKFDAVRHILTLHAPDKTLIYCKFLSCKAELEKQFPDIDIRTFGKHAYGLNLQQYNCIIFFDKTWDYAQRAQTEYRIFRTGQTENCTFYDLTGDLPLEDLINKNIENKTDLLQYFKQLTIKELKEVL